MDWFWGSRHQNFQFAAIYSTNCIANRWRTA